MTYGLWVACGMIAAFAASQLQAADRPDLEAHRPALLMAAVLGAVGGAFLAEVPADFLGWAWRPSDLPRDVLPLGGRTVLGGMLGGWVTVEAVKRFRGIRGPTGDRFALPLAVALAFGRLGCAAAGCCAGHPCTAWWAWHGRWPVAFVEVAFHALGAGLLWWAARRRIATGRRLALYLAAYGLLRFFLEFQRENPPLLAGLTWYQVLAMALMLIAGGTWWRRRAQHDMG